MRISLPVQEGKRPLIRLGGIILLLALFAACAPTAERAAEQVSKKEPQYGGIMGFGALQGPVQLNPYKGATYPENLTFAWSHDTLVNYDYKPGEDYRIDYAVVPWLAESWDQPNATTYVFHLRKDVRWHDGKPFTAADVVFSYEFMRDPQYGFGVVGSNLAVADKIERVDDYTVRITTKEPSAEFVQTLAANEMKLLPKHLFDEGGAQRFLETPVVGTGAYKITSYDRLKGVKYVRNEDYWMKGKPYMEGADLYYGLDESALLAAFKAQKTDFYNVNSKAEIDALRAMMPEVQWRPIVMPYNYSLYMRLDRPPFSDIRVRRAMHLVIDRQSLNKTITAGEGVINPPAGLAIKKGWGIPEDELMKLPGFRQPKDQDIEEAKRLLTEAGYPNGFKTSIKLVKTWNVVPAIAEAVSGQVRRIGIEMPLNPMDLGMWQDDVRKGNYEVFTHNGAWALPNKRLYQYYYSKGADNKMPINDPKLDQLIDAQNAELNVEKRKQLNIQIQRLVLENLYSIPGIDWVSYAVWQPWVHDYVPNYGSQAYIQNPMTAWLEASKIPSR